MSPASAAPADELAPDWRALRFVKWPDWVKEVDGIPRPMSVAFQDKLGGMSIFVEELVTRADRTVEQLMAVFPGSWLCYLTIDELVNEFKQVVTVDPVDLFPGHALVQDQNGKRSQGTRSRMAQRARWHEIGIPRPRSAG